MENSLERADFEQWKPKEVARLLALVETERRYYQEIVASVPVSLLIVGPDLQALSSNRHFRVTLGKKNEDILRHELSELLPIEGVVEIAQRAVSTGLAVPRIESVWKIGDVEKAVHVSALPLRSWEEDSNSEALIVIQEIAAPQIVQPPLTPEQAKALELADSVEAMLWEADLAAGKLTHVNARAEDLFGHGHAVWFENPAIWTERVAPEDRDRVTRFYDTIREGAGHVFSVEFLAQHAGGALFHARETVRVERDDSGKAIRLFGLTADISDRRLVESQSGDAMKGEALGRLSAKLAHDLNNLLMIVAGYGEELKNALPSSNPLHNDMKEILSATERLYSLTTQLQAYTRHPLINAKIVSIPALLAQAHPGIEKILGEKITLGVEQSADLAQAKIDSAQIEQALLALAQHAHLELGGQGSVAIHAANVRFTESTGTASRLDAGDYVRLTMLHSGPPMSAESRRQILEPWLYSEQSVRDVKMGLASAFNIVRESGGELSIETVPGQGTAIHLYLPMATAADLEAERTRAVPLEVAAPVEIPPEPETTLETILVVEDEGGIRALVRKILRRQGYNVLEASHGDEALRIMNDFKGPIDLLLTDVMMPGMNGVELSHKALALKTKLKVLFVSGYTDESLLEAGQFPAGTAFLQKPFTLGSLLGKVREVLDSGATRHATS